MVGEHQKPKFVFYLGWIVLSAICIPLAFGITWGIILLIERYVGGTIVVGGQKHITEDFLLSFIYFPMIGLLTGVLQYFLLRRYLPRMGWWIAATVIGWLLPFLVYAPLFSRAFPNLETNSIWFAVLSILLIGLSIAIPQWWVLRRNIRQASWWILFSLAGWGLMGFAVGQNLTGPLDFAAFGAFPALATGFALWLLLDRLAAPTALLRRT